MAVGPALDFARSSVEFHRTEAWDQNRGAMAVAAAGPDTVTVVAQTMDFVQPSPGAAEPRNKGQDQTQEAIAAVVVVVAGIGMADAAAAADPVSCPDQLL